MNERVNEERVGQKGGESRWERFHACPACSPLCREIPIDLWNFAVLLVRKVLGRELSISALDHEVELRGDGDLEVVHDPGQVEAPGLDLLAEHPKNGKIGGHLFEEAGVLDLDRHDRAVLEHGLVNLGRGAGERAR